MTDEEKTKKKLEAFEKRKQRYYSMSSMIQNMVWKLKDIERSRGHTTAFKQLMLALDAYDQQIRDDFSRYEKQINRRRDRDDVKQLQQALNRERTLRQELESKVKEASESSGLFIKFVRNKLGI